MKIDIEISIAKDVHVAIIHEWNDEFLSNKVPFYPYLSLRGMVF